MREKLFVDGRDAYVDFGVFIVDNGYNSLAQFPPLKKVAHNDWAEENGIEPDLSTPALDTREVDIKFAYHGSNARLDSFLDLLTNKAYHQFEFKEIGRSFRLRLVSQSDIRLAYRLGLFTLKFADDFPLDDYTYQSPESLIFFSDGYSIDGKKLSDYGVCVLEGSESEIMKSPAVKKKLLHNISIVNGANYDDKQVNFQAKEIKLKCLMRAKTLDEFWRNYDALLHDLTKPNERILKVDAFGKEFPCYYKSCSVDRFCPDGKIWLRFNLVLVFTAFKNAGMSNTYQKNI